MTFSFQHAAAATAVLLALFAVDAAIHAIDILGVPVPRLVMGISWSAAVCPVLALFFWPFRRSHRLWAFDTANALFALSLAAWLAIELLLHDGSRSYVLSLVFGTAAAWVAFLLTRAHLKVFGRPDILIVTFVAAAILLAAGQLLLIGLQRAGITFDAVRYDELVDRNSMTLLVVAGFYFASLPLAAGRALSQPAILGLLAFGFLYAAMNRARAAEILLVMAVGTGLVRAFLPQRVRVPVLALVVAVFAGVATFGGMFVRGLNTATATIDTQTSTMYRAQANAHMFDLFVQNPLFGAGLANVMHASAGGYVSHTLYLLISAAFGLAGLVGVAMLAALWLRDRSRRAERLSFLAFVMAAFTFFNDPAVWLGFGFAIVSLGLGRSDVAQRTAAPSAAPSHVILRMAGKWRLAAGAAALSIAGCAAALMTAAPYGARAEVVIGRMGISEPSSIESTREAARFVELSILRQEPAMRSACSVRPLHDRPVVVVACKGGSADDASGRVTRIVDLLLERHRMAFDDSLLTLRLLDGRDRFRISDLDRSAADMRSELASDASASDRTPAIALVENEAWLLRQTIAQRNRVRSQYAMTSLTPDGVIGYSRASAPIVFGLGVGGAFLALAAAFALALGEAFAGRSKPHAERTHRDRLPVNAAL